MITTIEAQYKQGQVLINNDVIIPDNTTIYVSFKDSTEDDFFLKASESSLENLWNNIEDDIYEQLLKK